PDRGGFVPEIDGRLCTSVADVFVAGDCAGLGATSIADPGRAVRQGRRAGLAAAASLGATAPDQRDELPADSSADHGSLAPSYEYWRTWLRVSLANGGRDVLACQCEEVTRGELLRVQPPRYLGWRSEPMSARNLDTLTVDGPLHPDQIKRLTRAGMGQCQGRRCREQVASLLADAGRVQ